MTHCTSLHEACIGRSQGGLPEKMNKMAQQDPNKKPARASADPTAIIAVIKRVLSENAREYIPQYIIALTLLLATGGATAGMAWVMQPLVDTRSSLSPALRPCAGSFTAPSRPPSSSAGR